MQLLTVQMIPLAKLENISRHETLAFSLKRVLFPGSALLLPIRDTRIKRVFRFDVEIDPVVGSRTCCDTLKR